MAKTTKNVTPVTTRAEKKDAAKNVIREILAEKPLKHNELIEEAAKRYTERFGGDNVNDVNGRIGSVLDIMKKESDVAYEGGVYALKARGALPADEVAGKTAEESAPENTAAEDVKKTTRTRAKKAVKKPEAAEAKEEVKEEKTAEKEPVKRAKRTRAKKGGKEETDGKEEKATPLPAQPLQPIAPVAPVTPETAPEPMPAKEGKGEETPAEKPAPKKRGRKPKAQAAPAVIKTEISEKTEEKAQENTEEKTEKPVENLPVVPPKAEIAKNNVVMDMSFLFGSSPRKAPADKAEQADKAEKSEKPAEKTSVKPPVKAAEKPAEKSEKPSEKPAESKPITFKTAEKRPARVLKTVKKAVERPLTAEEKLRESFLKKLRSLGGDYFEYYSVYLLERYSMKNGRRLEGMKVSGGERDGGIDGEIELTDKLGFKETIYIQAKNWNPDKGDERLWVVGETLLQQFIGACACRQAKEGKQHCRGIFITTSRFTPDAKRILEDLSDKIVGYDGEDLFEAAKECKFGLVYENGNWKLDEKLLSGPKAFFNMF